jgi:hypothetical protein
MISVNRKSVFVIFFRLVHFSIYAQKVRTIDTLLKGFVSPSNASRPRVWWHWMNGNITKEGIRKDLESMHRSGIGGFQNFDAAMITPKVVEKRLMCVTPEWIFMSRAWKIMTLYLRGIFTATTKSTRLLCEF